jgi:nitroreductase
MSRDEALDPRLQFLHDRRTVSRLDAPGPGPAELTALLAAADTAPDHGVLHPWRFHVLDDDDRRRVSTAYADAQRSRAVGGDAGLVERAASKPLRGPCVIAAFARTVEHPKVADWEQLAAAAAAVQNLCLAATALGFGTAWRTGWFVEHEAVRAALGAEEDERVIGMVHVGTPGRREGSREESPG